MHSTYDVARLILLKICNIDNIILDFYLLIGQMILQVSFEKPYNTKFRSENTYEIVSIGINVQINLLHKSSMIVILIATNMSLQNL